MSEIVDFADLAKFINVPVKRYSSGMYMRLAFSVIAHMRPDIVLIDEVLAVGDLSFQSRCVERLQEMVAEGAAVVFVSHNLHLVSGFCHRAILLDRGANVSEGYPMKVIDQYIGRQVESDSGQRSSSQEIEILSIEIANLAGLPCYEFESGDSIRVRITYRVAVSLVRFGCHLVARRSDGVASGGATTIVEPEPKHEAGIEHVVECTIREARLIRGWYRVDIYFSDPTHVVDYAMMGSPAFRIRGDSALDDRFGSYALATDWNDEAQPDGPSQQHEYFRRIRVADRNLQ
jgi:lipopolysaccharide transport system ATP-binding protein